MKPSGSREKLFAQAATASPANLGSTPPPLSHLQPCPKHKDTTDSDVEKWMREIEEWGRQRKSRIVNVEAGKSAGSSKPPAGSSSSSSSSSFSKQATARQVAAELIRLGDTSLSAPLLSASGTAYNLLLLQVNQESSSSVAHSSAEEHALSNERKRKELQDLQGGAITERSREEWKAMNLKAAQDMKAQDPDEEPPVAKPPRNIRVASLEEMPGPFTAAKSVMDMEYCVKNLTGLRVLAGRTTSASSVTSGHRTIRAPLL
jgi:hypothetical protein